MKGETRLRLAVRGAVQGVGFRPFVFRLATEIGLAGWVRNDSEGVLIEVEGSRENLEAFLLRIEPEKPTRSVIQGLAPLFLDPVGYTRFEIGPSDTSGEKTTWLLPDIATCQDCLKELFDPADRRFRYPFINCVNCGPRFSIVESIPYDRSRTTMRRFEMCDDCRLEYDDPRDRRFHAEPNACPLCGPQWALWDSNGKILSSGYEGLIGAAEAIRRGEIVALKGLGGFHLIVNAGDESAVVRLRKRKGREEKPFALMYPSVAAVQKDCRLSDLEARLLLSPESPILLLDRKVPRLSSALAPSVAPDNPIFGVTLPYTPAHHLLMRELGFPIVATSGNLSEEPICIDEGEALERLHGIADLFLVHDRPIARRVDDSIVRVMMGRGMMLRRARGYAPLPIRVPGLEEAAPGDSAPILAVGGHTKNTVAVKTGADVFISPHVGDLETKPALDAFYRAVDDLQRLYGVAPRHVASDMNPDYLSTKGAGRMGRRTSRLSDSIETVQHHHAHVVSCMAENGIRGKALGVAWDGSGYGPDGTIWGGEFLPVDEGSFVRAGHLRTFPLPGGKRAIREPRRSAIGLLFEIFGEETFTMRRLPPLRSFSIAELKVIREMLVKGVNAPVTSSAGRLFDAVAALVGLHPSISFEGQAAMAMEFAIDGREQAEKRDVTNDSYSFRCLIQSVGEAIDMVVDWEPMVHAILQELEEGISVGVISEKFHNTLVEMIIDVSRRIGRERVVLSGGCFQNRYLLERTVRRLEEEGFRPYWHQRVPPNDGGLSLGQAVAAANRIKERFNVSRGSGKDPQRQR